MNTTLPMKTCRSGACMPTRRVAHTQPRLNPSVPRMHVCQAKSTVNEPVGISRRDGIFMGLLLVPNLVVKPGPVSAGVTQQKLDPAALQAFQSALNANGDFEAKDAAWTKVLELAPNNSAAWSNRGTLRLQYGRWAGAESDLAHAVNMEAQPGTQNFGPDAVAVLNEQQLSQVDASTLNNLGNAEVALGKLPIAQTHFQIASRDAGLREIALANLALAAFEAQDDQVAIRVARQVLRRDPAFLDASAALVAFLYGSGKTAEAEAQWEELQRSEDGFGGYLYNKGTAVSRVQGRWPPRATAAMTAFVNLAQEGTVEGYDKVQHTYKFNV